MRSALVERWWLNVLSRCNLFHFTNKDSRERTNIADITNINTNTIKPSSMRFKRALRENKFLIVHPKTCVIGSCISLTRSIHYILK
ncbi:hypothetical protein ALQ57_200052 [Pseudomonas amygdali pv. hibisci]|nr:hypothetical protein ALQ57_200052 [Pseudomonas amygdali pv. hibisci]